MRRKSLVWRLFPTYFLITFASVLALGLCTSAVLHGFYRARAEADLEVRTRMARREIESVSGHDTRRIAALVRHLGEASGARITVIAADGSVLADSVSDPAQMENHLDRPEVRAALLGKTGKNRRVSPTLGFATVYLALPLRYNGRISGVVRSAVSATTFDTPPRIVYLQILLGTVVIALISGIVCFIVARQVGGELARMKEAAARFAEGDYHARVPVSDTEEFASLAETLNRTGTWLSSQLRTITEQAGEREAILSSMKEGVIAIDTRDRVITINPAAASFLDVSVQWAQGRAIHEVVRNPDLQRFFERVHAEPELVTQEIVLHTPDVTLLQATGTTLADTQGRRMGALVVLNDITRTRKLEEVRKDFAANVSHELRTPITSIKGFVETLREGALEDPEKARDFLSIVAAQADRLNAIIEDLLALSRIEREAEADSVVLEPTRLRTVLETAVASCEAKASEQKVSVKVECDADLEAEINAPLLEQAVGNLVDNAVKYAPGGTVTVTAERANDEIIIRVVDTGCGIAAEHIPRLFERFYRVDKARSRKVGGTGLGLAIVKHIAQAHRGRVTVESTPGQGSTFSIYVPASVERLAGI